MKENLSKDSISVGISCLGFWRMLLNVSSFIANEHLRINIYVLIFLVLWFCLRLGSYLTWGHWHLSLVSSLTFSQQASLSVTTRQASLLHAFTSRFSLLNADCVNIIIENSDLLWFGNIFDRSNACTLSYSPPLCNATALLFWCHQL